MDDSDALHAPAPRLRPWSNSRLAVPDPRRMYYRGEVRI